MKIPIGKSTKDLTLPVYLTQEDHPHIHITGLSQSGKSTFLLHVLKELIKYRKGFCLIDPHGELYRQLIAFLALLDSTAPVHLFDPSYEKRIVGFNPFISPYNDEARLMTKASRMCTATLRVFGLSSSDYYGNIERWLRSIYYTLLELGLTVTSLDTFLYWDRQQEREQLINRLKSQTVKNELKEFYSVSRQEFKKDLQSTRNKLQRFTHPHAKKILGLTTNNLDLQTIVDKGHILLCNLQPAEDDLIGSTETNLLGTLLINELWELTRKRKQKVDYYFIVDECHQYVGQDVKSMLTETAKYGLRVWLSHQEMSQVKEIEGALKSARTKIAFGQTKHFTLTRVNGEAIQVEAPDVKKWVVPEQKIEMYQEKKTASYLTPCEIDSLFSNQSIKPVTDKELTYTDFIR